MKKTIFIILLSLTTSIMLGQIKQPLIKHFDSVNSSQSSQINVTLPQTIQIKDVSEKKDIQSPFEKYLAAIIGVVGTLLGAIVVGWLTYFTEKRRFNKETYFKKVALYSEIIRTCEALYSYAHNTCLQSCIFSFYSDGNAFRTNKIVEKHITKSNEQFDISSDKRVEEALHLAKLFAEYTFYFGEDKKIDDFYYMLTENNDLHLYYRFDSEEKFKTCKDEDAIYDLVTNHFNKKNGFKEVVGELKKYLLLKYKENKMLK